VYGAAVKVCHHCRRELTLMSASVGRTESCPHCHSDLKCCLNCTFFDPGAHNQCREPQAEWCPEKAKANFCEFFQFRDTSAVGPPGAGARSDQEHARSAFDSLFKK
jgi:hypothetical protein